MKKLTFKQRMMLERESLIIETVNHLLATKGYDAMTVDEIADTVGIAKASLYRHFPSKEALGMAALVDIMHKALEVINQLNATDRLRAGPSRRAPRPHEPSNRYCGNAAPA